MATTATVSNGIVTLRTRLSVAELSASNISVVSRSGTTPGSNSGRASVAATVANGGYQIHFSMTGVKISVYRSVDIGSDGQPTSSPYFGSVSSDRFRNRHGPITTDTLGIFGIRFFVFASHPPAVGGTLPPARAPSFRVADINSVLNVGVNGIRITETGDPSGIFPHTGFFSELLCAGTWVVRLRFDCRLTLSYFGPPLISGRYRNLGDIGYDARVTEAATVVVPTSRPCPGTGTTPTAPTDPTAPTAPTDPTDPGQPTAPPPTGGGGAPPPVVVVTGSKPVVSWNDTNLFRSFRSPIDGVEISPIRAAGMRTSSRL